MMQRDRTESIAAMASASGEMSVTYGDILLAEPLQEALLGHRGFLQYFDATFSGAKREVKLRRNAEQFPAT